MSFVYFSILLILFFNFKDLNCNSKTNHTLQKLPKNFKYFQISLDSENKYKLFWTLDYDAEVVNFEVRAKVLTRNDWFAIGFSDYGDVQDADLCVVWFDRTNKYHFDVSIIHDKIQRQSY